MNLKKLRQNSIYNVELWAQVGLWIISGLLVIFALNLHLAFAQNAGGLWRDEVVTANVAGRKAWSQILDMLRYESFPGLVHVMLSVWVDLCGNDGDAVLRAFGCLVGLGLLLALWCYRTVQPHFMPLVTVVMFCANPVYLRATDSIRSYGIGSFLVAALPLVVWRILQRPGFTSTVLALVVSVLSVHALYQNAFLLAAVLGAGMTVSLLQRRWHQLGLLLAFGVSAALSLCIYLDVLRELSEMQHRLAMKSDLWHLLGLFRESFSQGGVWQLILCGLSVLGMFGMAWANLDIAKGPVLKNESQIGALFFLLCFVYSAGLFIGWLLLLGMPGQMWYFAPLSVLMCVCVDYYWSSFMGQKWWAALGMLLLIYQGSNHESLHKIVITRQTNLDWVAAAVMQNADKADYIIVHPFYCGTGFQRYYRGDVAWDTLPPLPEYVKEGQSVQRLMWAIQQTEPIQPVLNQVKRTLRAGHAVWLVGGVRLPPPGQNAPRLAPAPGSVWGWNYNIYSEVWSMQLGEYLQQHATEVKDFTPSSTQTTNPLETLTLLCVRGYQ